ncbi:MAG: hypothetical protein EB127_26810 [Alphaproteobacteria bacterium]|nr:hypothetical protein [Alphaproteobacteria bacterium]
MHICITEIDAATRIVCTQEPMRTGPALPNIKGFQMNWVDKSTWPVELAHDGTYLRAPKYYGTCDDDADLSVSGVLEVLTEEDFIQRKQVEIEARRPFPSWVFNEEIGEWTAPFPRPADAIINGGTVAYTWDEETIGWIPL